MKTNLTHGTLLKPAIVLLASMSLYGHCAANHNACGGLGAIVISHDTTWRHSPPATYGGGNIIIADGVTFTIDSVQLRFHNNAIITSKPSPTSAVHLIMNGDTLVGCSGGISNEEWGGVQIKGVSDTYGYSEYNSSLGMNTSQSSLVANNCYIQNASEGLMVSYHAIIQLYNDYFLNCYVGAAVMDSVIDYNYTSILSHTSPSPVACQSYIENCGFNMQAIGPGLGNYLDQYICVNLYKTQYLEIYGNYFECTDSATYSGYGRAKGIYAVDANFSCHSTNGSEDPATGCVMYSGIKVQNRFIGLSYGILASEDSFTYTLHLDDNYFSQCFVAMDIRGGAHHVIHANNIRFTDSTLYWKPGVNNQYNNLVWLDRADNFVFYGNRLTENKTHTAFLYIDSSGTDQKNISIDTFINLIVPTYTASTSADTEYALCFSGDNRNQTVTCNYFQNHHYAIYCSISAILSPFGYATHQFPPFPLYIGAGNVFSPTTTFSTNGIFGLYNANTTIGDTVDYYTAQLNFLTDHANYPHGIFMGTGMVDGEDGTHVTDSCGYIETCKNWGPLGFQTANPPAIAIGVYPDPAMNQVFFDFSSANIPANQIRLDIFDALGRNMGFYNATGGLKMIAVNSTGFPNGVYVYRAEMGNNMVKTGKFEVRH